MLLRVVEFAAARGHDPELLCRSAGLQLAGLREADARVPYTLAERLNQRAAELTRDANIGLHLAHDVRESRHADLGLLLLMASEDVRTALDHFARYQRYWGDGERASLLRAAGGVAIRYSMAGPSGSLQRHSDECALAEITLGLRTNAAGPIVPRAVRFRHAAPRDSSEHRELFDCPIEFSAPHTELVLDDATLQTPMRHANGFYAEIFRQHVERTLAELPEERALVHEVRAVVRSALASGTWSLAKTARTLGVTPRTLQRRLEAEQTSFDALVDALRRELALRYLDQSVAVAEIAQLLGYGETSAFHRAFKRWTGTTPERARNLRRANGSFGELA